MRASWRRTMAVALLLAASLVPASGSIGANAPLPDPRAELQDGLRQPSARARQLERDLGRLEQAWAAAGGEYGYPFWEKAAHRWRMRAISAAMYREYVTGYRDRLVPGEARLDALELDSRVGRDVRNLLVDATKLRLDALRSQERALEARIERGRSRATLVPEDAEALDEQIATHDAAASDLLQQSYRATRLALNHAQAALDASSLPRLAEDAFI